MDGISRPTTGIPNPAGWLRRHEQALLPWLIIATLAAYYLTPSPALSWLWLALLAALTWRAPGVTLALLPLTFPFWFVPKRVTANLVFPLSEVTLAVVALVVAARAAWRLRPHPLTPSPARRGGSGPGSTLPWARAVRFVASTLLRRVGALTALGGALLLVGMTLGVVIALRPHEALRAWRWEALEPLLYLALALWYLGGRRWARMTLWAMIGSGLLIAALATLQTLWWHVTFTPVSAGERLINDLSVAGAPYRATAIIYGSGNSAGAWLERALPLALALALCGRGLPRRERWLAAASALALLPAIFWTDSRGAWLGAAAGSGLLVAFWLAPLAARMWSGVGARTDILTYRVWRWPALVAGVGALLMLATGGWSLWGATLTSIATAGHSDTGAVRLLLWQSALHMIHDHPLLGVGPDQFLYYYDPAYTSHPYLISRIDGRPTVAVNQPDLAHPHNLLLDLWLSAGLLGLIGYTLVVWQISVRALVLWRAGAGHHQPWRRIVVVGVLGALAATLTHGMLDSAYFVPDLALAFWWGVVALATVA